MIKSIKKLRYSLRTLFKYDRDFKRLLMIIGLFVFMILGINMRDSKYEYYISPEDQAYRLITQQTYCHYRNLDNFKKEIRDDILLYRALAD